MKEFKVRIGKNEQLSRMVHQHAFKLGYGYYNLGQTKLPNVGFLYFHGDGSLVHDRPQNIEMFNNNDFKEMHLVDFFEMGVDINDVEKVYQTELMKYDPTTGEEKPYPSNAEQYREYHMVAAWLYNPWTGERRNADSVGSDVKGRLIKV